jgi:hypothetical protein
VAFVNPDERNEGHIGYSRFSDVFGGRMLSFMHGELERALGAAVADRVTIRHGTTVAMVARFDHLAEITSMN